MRETLGTALPKEMQRVRELLPLYDAIPAGVFAATMMRADLDGAAKACASADIRPSLRDRRGASCGNWLGVTWKTRGTAINATSQFGRFAASTVASPIRRRNRPVANINFIPVVRRLAQCIEFQADKRDEAEQALSQAYYLVTGNSPKWSETFGYAEALEDIKDACILMRASIMKQKAS